MQETTSQPPRQMQTVHWIIAIALAVIATALWMRPGSTGGSVALAQNQGMAGARGVFAFTGQIDNDRYGLFMLDVDQGTIWCYELDRVDGVRKLKLLAGRTWTYDRYLQDFNCAKPSFRDVQNLIGLQRNAAAPDTNSPVRDASDLPASNP